jgi:hypothetical protein
MARVLRRAAWAVLLVAWLPASCGKDGDSGTSASSAPQVSSCSSVVYRGVTYSNLGCAPGVASFTATITQGGNTACFNITCASGCISTARVC